VQKTGETMTLPKSIAIDGPAASGKTTLGKNLADELGYLFFDTGVMYRAVTWLAIQNRVSFEDEVKITELSENCEIDVRPASKPDGRNNDILANGQDITWAIRQPEIDANVSLVSSYPGVRQALSKQQRKIGLRGEVVMVGRDIGTVVLPEAEVKFYLDASAEERARRRFKEIQSRQNEASYQDILAAVIARDRFDSTRDIAPLRAANDAIMINSDNLNAEQVLEKVKELLSK
jgi:CMP/dCMP kinase